MVRQSDSQTETRAHVVVAIPPIRDSILVSPAPLPGTAAFTSRNSRLPTHQSTTMVWGPATWLAVARFVQFLCSVAGTGLNGFVTGSIYSDDRDIPLTMLTLQLLV